MSPKQLFKSLRARGWYIHSESKHYKWRHNDHSGQVITSKTPSDRRAVKNILADFKRIEDGNSTK